jgi:hypothetical protein
VGAGVSSRSKVAPASAGAAGPVVPCPHCGRPLDPLDATGGTVVCVCGHRAYAGYVAEALSLQARLQWLRARVDAGDPVPPVEVARQWGVWTPPAVPGPVPAPATGVQTILLTIGALLLVVAAIVFTAVMWRHVGAAGQVALLAVLTVGVAVIAAWLHPRLRSTAEALAVVAFSLAGIDAIASPRLGLFPEGWADVTHVYPAAIAAVLAVAAVAAGHLTGLRSWVWLGWLSATVASGLTAVVVGDATGGTPTTYAASLALVTVTGVLLLAAPRLVPPDRDPLVVAGATALTAGVPVVARLAVGGDGRPGALATTVVTTAVLAFVWRWQRTTLFAWGAVVGASAAVAVALLLPGDPQVVWLGAACASCAALVAAVVARAGNLERGLAGAGVLCATWVTGRLFDIGEELPGVGQEALARLVREQVSWLTLVVAVTGFAMAWWSVGGDHAAWLAWPAAVAAEIGLVLAHPASAPEVLEAVTLPFAMLLLGAGLVATRRTAARSLVRYGPAVTAALVPSALFAWWAPWVVGDEAAPGEPWEHVVRLLLVLAAGGVLVVVGAWRHLAGLVLPAAAALAVAAAAQVWTGFAALPRWIGLAFVGLALVLAGARIEWLRREGHRASSWLHELT